MPDTDKTEAEKKASQDELRREETSELQARGNVHSEAEDDTPKPTSPPPLAY